MSTKLFVGGLPWAMDNERLKQVFAEFGDLEDARVILDRETGQSRGFGFVTYANDAGAEKALALNGQEIDGRRVRVDRATEKERPARPGGAGPGRPRPEGGGGRPPAGGSDRDRRPPAAAAPAPTPDRPSDRDRGRGGREPGPRNFNDDWGGGPGPGRDKGRKVKGGADSSKNRGRRRGGRGARSGGEGGEGTPDDDFDDFDY